MKNTPLEIEVYYILCCTVCAYMHTINICQSAILINQTTCIGGKQISPTSARIIVMPRNAGQPDGSEQQLNRTDQVLNSVPVSLRMATERLVGDRTGSRARWASHEVRIGPPVPVG